MLLLEMLEMDTIDIENTSVLFDHPVHLILK